MKLPKHAELWFPSYLRSRIRHHTTLRPPKRLWVALTDHFEPCGNTTPDTAHRRMAAWEARWPDIVANAPRDSEDHAPVFTAFYPQEEYNPAILDRMAELTRAGISGTFDVEVHLHHFHDTAQSFVDKIQHFTDVLRRDHGLLHTHRGKPVFGFIHGNWALDNSHPAGHGCGVTGELQLLRDLGCYADFTMPSLPSPTQSRIVNRIYWTAGDPARPRGFDRGVEATVGGDRQGDLLMMSGPTGLRFRGRLLPRLESGELAAYDLPTPYRVQRWLDLAPRLGDDLFLKLYGHSAREDNAAALLGDGRTPAGFENLFRWIAEAARARQLELHWASAFQMFQAVDALIRPASAAA